MAGKLRRELGLIDIFCIASGAMISSGLFILPGLAHAKAGPAVILSYFLAGLFSLAGMLSIAEMTTAMPRAGGDCFTIIRSMGPAVGTVAGLLSWFSLSMKSAFALVGMSVFTVLILDVDIHVIAVGFALLFIFVNLVGIKEASKTQVFMVGGMLLLMLVYLILGLPKVSMQKLEPFAPNGVAAVFSTAGFVFVSYAGLLKIASVAEEIKNPGRNIPLGMILSLLVVSVFYALMVLVVSGVMDAEALHSSMTPISDAAAVFMGRPGLIVMSIAAILAFLSTANAGIMTASRSLVPLSADGLLPDFLGSINKRFKTPHNALLFTGFLVVVSLFLNLEMLVKTASLVLILTNMLSILSIVILRESRLQNYQPRFKAPLYPWLQILGFCGLCFLVFEMGKEAFFMSSLLVVAGLLVYWFYSRIRTNREYALLHLVERITSNDLTTHILETELKEILRERDEIVKDRFDHIIEDAVVLDIEGPIGAEEFFAKAAASLASKLDLSEEKLSELLLERESKSSTVLNPDLAAPHVVIEGEGKFHILLARCKQGIRFSEDAQSVSAVFVLVGTEDERNFHLLAISAIAQIVLDPDFEKKWMRARNVSALRDLLLLGKRRRLQLRNV